MICPLCNMPGKNLQYFHGYGYIHAHCKGKMEAASKVYATVERNTPMEKRDEVYALLEGTLKVLEQNHDMSLSSEAGRLKVALEISRAVQDGRLKAVPGVKPW